MQKKDEVKEKEVKVEDTKAAVKADVAEEKKESAAKKTTATKAAKSAKTAEPKETAKKKVGRPPKKADEKSTVQTVLEFQGKAIDLAKIEERVKAQFVADGHRAGNIKTLSIYVKPEDYKAYYVINDGKFSGDVDLF